MAIDTTSVDRRAARLKYELAVRGFTCSALERKYSLTAGRCRHALYEPDEAGENAIARALGQPPQTIWPERFDHDGLRLIPQPPANYRTRGFGESRRKEKAA